MNVVVRDRPELFGKAVAVSWGQGATAGGSGTAEISSANYEAREFGVAAGMFVREAKRRCPELVIVNYDFAAYEEVSLSPWMANREIGSMTWTILFWSQSALDFCAPIPPRPVNLPRQQACCWREAKRRCLDLVIFEQRLAFREDVA